MPNQSDLELKHMPHADSNLPLYVTRILRTFCCVIGVYCFIIGIGSLRMDDAIAVFINRGLPRKHLFDIGGEEKRDTNGAQTF